MYPAHSLLDISPVRLGTSPSQRLAKLDKEQESSRKHKRKHPRRDKRILNPTRSQPRRNPIIKSKRHHIADQNHSNQTLPREILVRVDDVIDGHAASSGDTEADHAHSNDETTDGDAVRGAHAPEDQTRRHDE